MADINPDEDRWHQEWMEEQAQKELSAQADCGLAFDLGRENERMRVQLACATDGPRGHFGVIGGTTGCGRLISDVLLARGVTVSVRDLWTKVPTRRRCPACLLAAQAPKAQP